MPDMAVNALWVVVGYEKINPKGGRVLHITPEELNEVFFIENESVKKGKSR